MSSSVTDVPMRSPTLARRGPYPGAVRALVIGNAGDFDPGFVGHHLRRRGYAFVEAHREHPDQWSGLDGIDLVLTLGSEWSVYWPDIAALVEAEAAVVRDASPGTSRCWRSASAPRCCPTPSVGPSADRPPGDRLVPAGRAGGGEGPWMEWHDDVFTVPEGSTCSPRPTSVRS